MPRPNERGKDARQTVRRNASETGSWEEAFVAALEADDLEGLFSVLDSQKTAHAGTPRQAVKLKAVKLIERHYGGSLASLYKTGVAFARSRNEGAQEIGLVVLAPQFDRNPAEVTEIVLELADSENWEVREWAASALRRIIAGEFDAIFATLQAWAGHESPNLRRAVAVAGAWAAKDLTEERCRLMLEVLGPLMEDDDPYVRKNMGAYAIGDSFLKAQPKLVAAWLGMASENERSHWNVAMALSSAEAANHFELLSKLLWGLAADDRTVVRRATYRAVLNLAKRLPCEIVPLVASWKTDSQRSHVYLRVWPKIEDLETQARPSSR